MKEFFTKPGFVESLPKEVQDILPPAKYFHVGDRLCILIAQNSIVYWDVEKRENVPLKASDGASPAWMLAQLEESCKKLTVVIKGREVGTEDAFKAIHGGFDNKSTFVYAEED